MTEVTYFVALPFVAAEDGIAAGEPTECFIRLRLSCARKLCRASRDMWEPLHSAERAIRPPAISAMQSSLENLATCRVI
jgi:hypothetical protein